MKQLWGFSYSCFSLSSLLLLSIFISFTNISCSQGALSLNWPAAKSSSANTTPGNTAPTLSNANETQALQILQTNCTSCHGTSSGPNNVFDLTDPTHLVSAGLVVVGDPNSSELFNEVSSGAMPPGGPLSSADQLVLQNWIADTQ